MNIQLRIASDKYSFEPDIVTACTYYIIIIPILIMNLSNQEITLYRDTPLGQFHSATNQRGETYEIPTLFPQTEQTDEEIEVVGALDKPNDHPMPHFDLSYSNINSEQKKRVE